MIYIIIVNFYSRHSSLLPLLICVLHFVINFTYSFCAPLEINLSSFAAFYGIDYEHVAYYEYFSFKEYWSSLDFKTIEELERSGLQIKTMADFKISLKTFMTQQNLTNVAFNIQEAYAIIDQVGGQVEHYIAGQVHEQINRDIIGPVDGQADHYIVGPNVEIFQ